MSKVKAFLTVLFSAIGVLGAREFYKPRNIKQLLEWKGVKLASDSRAGNSMFFENEEELKGMKIENADALGAGCVEKFKVTNLSDDIFNEAKKYCSDNPTTIMARIIREGEEDRVIKKGNIESYKINYLLATNKQEVLALVNAFEPIEAAKVAEHLSNFCENEKRTKVVSSSEKDKIATFKKRCYDLEVKTFSELLKKQGLTLMQNEDEFKSKFKGKLEYAKEFGPEMKKDFEARKGEFTTLMNTSEEMRKKYPHRNGGDTDLFEEYGGMVYSKWCRDRRNISLLDTKVETTNFDAYQKFSYRCSVESEI